MQIQGTGEIGSTKRKFHLSGVPLIESRLYNIFTFGISDRLIVFSLSSPSLLDFSTSFKLQEKIVYSDLQPVRAGPVYMFSLQTFIKARKWKNKEKK